jgi:integrase/recombinase XerD
MKLSPIPPASDALGVAPEAGRLLSAAQFQQLRAVPPEAQWFANLDNAGTRRVYQHDLTEFMRYVGIAQMAEFRVVTRAHILAWRAELETRGLAGSTIRRKLAALSSLFEYLCEAHAVTHNPVKGVKRPKVEGYEGKTPALGDHQARALLAAPSGDGLQAKRDRAMLSTLLHHALRREELTTLKVRDVHERRGVKHFRVHGKGRKIRYVPVHPGTLEAIDAYLEAAGHGAVEAAPLFASLRESASGTPRRAITPDGVYKLIRAYAIKAGVKNLARAAHAMRATAATHALDNGADIAKVQEWLGHASIATTRVYDHRRTRPEDSPTFKVAY